MSNPTIDFMQMNALQDLYNGNIMPWDKQILEDMPIPSDMVDPFASEEVKPLSVMNLTYVSLSGWIAEAKKANYYSERFVQLSKLVMKGVTTMGRGLVTLHKRGEDLSPAPMQIDDLISVGSYHFRKSYLGVVQFSAKHPEIGERLLVNQLGWADLLMRLYKTKEKLELNEKLRIKNEELPASNEEGRMKNEGLPDGNSNNSSFFIHNSSLSDNSSFDKLDESDISGAGAFSGLDALFAPAAFSAQRALTPMRNSKCGIRNSGKKDSETAQEQGTRLKDSEEEQEMKNEDSGQSSAFGVQSSEEEIQKSVTEEQETGSREKGIPEQEEEIQKPVTEEQETGSREKKIPEPEEEIQNPVSEEQETGNRDQEIPPHLQILQNVYARSGDSDKGALTFTVDEMIFLANDPGFNQIYPRSAAQFRDILAKIPMESDEDSS